MKSWAQTEVQRLAMPKEKSQTDLLPEAFATTREASVRTIGQRHFDVQLIGGIALHKGALSLEGEMKTAGEKVRRLSLLALVTLAH